MTYPIKDVFHSITTFVESLERKKPYNEASIKEALHSLACLLPGELVYDYALLKQRLAPFCVQNPLARRVHALFLLPIEHSFSFQANCEARWTRLPLKRQKEIQNLVSDFIQPTDSDDNRLFLYLIVNDLNIYYIPSLSDWEKIIYLLRTRIFCDPRAAHHLFDLLQNQTISQRWRFLKSCSLCAHDNIVETLDLFALITTCAPNLHEKDLETYLPLYYSCPTSYKRKIFLSLVVSLHPTRRYTPVIDAIVRFVCLHKNDGLLKASFLELQKTDASKWLNLLSQAIVLIDRYKLNLTTMSVIEFIKKFDCYSEEPDLLYCAASLVEGSFVRDLPSIHNVMGHFIRSSRNERLELACCLMKMHLETRRFKQKYEALLLLKKIPSLLRQHIFREFDNLSHPQYGLQIMLSLTDRLKLTQTEVTNLYHLFAQLERRISLHEFLLNFQFTSRAPFEDYLSTCNLCFTQSTSPSEKEFLLKCVRYLGKNPQIATIELLKIVSDKLSLLVPYSKLFTAFSFIETAYFPRMLERLVVFLNEEEFSTIPYLVVSALALKGEALESKEQMLQQVEQLSRYSSYEIFSYCTLMKSIPQRDKNELISFFEEEIHSMDLRLTLLKIYLSSHPEERVTVPLLKKIDEVLGVDILFEEGYFFVSLFNQKSTSSLDYFLNLIEKIYPRLEEQNVKKICCRQLMGACVELKRYFVEVYHRLFQAKISLYDFQEVSHIFEGLTAHMTTQQVMFFFDAWIHAPKGQQTIQTLKAGLFVFQTHDTEKKNQLINMAHLLDRYDRLDFLLFCISEPFSCETSGDFFNRYFLHQVDGKARSYNFLKIEFTSKAYELIHIRYLAQQFLTYSSIYALHPSDSVIGKAYTFMILTSYEELMKLKNPYNIFNHLLVTRIQDSCEVVNLGEYQGLSFDQKSVKQIAVSSKFFVKNIPSITFREIFDQIGARLEDPCVANALEENFPKQDPYNPEQMLPASGILWTLSYNFIHEKMIEEHLKISSLTQPVDKLTYCLYEILSMLEQASSLVIEGQGLSEREEMLLKFSEAVLGCSTGQHDGIINYYRYTNRKTMETSEEQVISSEILKAYQETIEEVLSSRSFLSQFYAGTPIVQESHQTLYLKNKLYLPLGLQHDPEFDLHTDILQDRLVNATAGELLRLFEQALPLEALVLNIHHRLVLVFEKKPHYASILSSLLGEELTWDDDAQQLKVSLQGTLILLKHFRYLKPVDEI